MNSSNTNVGGWNDSLMRSFLNGRFYDAIPTVWKSIIKNVRVPSTAGDQSTEIIYAYDNIYLESYNALSNNNTSPYVDESDYITWYTSNQLRAKYLGQIIPDDATYYTTASEPSTLGNTVNAGDCWQPNGGSNVNYIAITLDEYNKLPWTNTNTYHGTATQDGTLVWCSSCGWWLRSPYAGNSTNFWYVTTSGTLNSNGASTLYGVVPGFSI